MYSKNKYRNPVAQMIYSVDTEHECQSQEEMICGLSVQDFLFNIEAHPNQGNQLKYFLESLDASGKDMPS